MKFIIKSKLFAFRLGNEGDDIRCAMQSNNTAWREGSCTSCKCVDNKVHCYTELCESSPKCKRSLTVKGKCCPICLGKYYLKCHIFH